MLWPLFGRKKKDIPEGLWVRCEGCKKPVFKKAMEDNLDVCPECKFHFDIGAPRRIGITLDPGSFVELDGGLEAADPLSFVARKSYVEKLEEDQKATGLREAILAGEGLIGGHPVIFGALDGRFIKGSMGSVVGEKFARAAERAAARRIPLVMFAASGGARMMEGILSLMQMAKTAAALARLDDAGGLYISVLTNPTTAGVMASFASLGDIILAEPGALIGFTGPRVIQQTIRASLPKGFQTSEFLLERGFIDRVIPRAKMREELIRILDYCAPGIGRKAAARA
ncbi:MAG: acetyl-CoA carboxylase, carboxyltransferase subunit beta [Planctomycetota bacterium]